MKRRTPAPKHGRADRYNQAHADVLLAAHLWNETPGLRLNRGHRLAQSVHFVAGAIQRRCWRFTGAADE